jgi:hypothetical protein
MNRVGILVMVALAAAIPSAGDQVRNNAMEIGLTNLEKEFSQAIVSNSAKP